MPILGTMAYIWHRCLLRRSRAADDEYEMDGGEVREFRVHPTETFGLATHPLAHVAGGKGPQENAALVKKLLTGGMRAGEPIMDFVLVNAAALIAVAGVVEGTAEVGADGVMRGTLWTNAVAEAQRAAADGASWECWTQFAALSQRAAAEQREL